MPSAVYNGFSRHIVAKHVLSKPTTTMDAVQRTIQNRLQPVLQLCPDVLEYLFLMAASLETSYTSLRRSIIVYSQVCHDWRNISLSVKRLWAQLIDFDSSSRQWNEEMLRRSHPLPIRISYQADLSISTKAFAFQLDHLSRIQTYSLGCQDTDWDTLVSMLSRPAPLLEKLYITCYRTFSHNVATSSIFPWCIFDGQAPNLRRVELKECIIDLRSPLLRCIRALRVIDLSYDNAPTAVQWLHHLRNMPQLEELYLQGAILPTRFHSSLGISNDADADPMPVIINLNIEAPLSDIALLTQHLQLPRKCNWTLTCSNSSPGADLENVLTVFSRGVDCLSESSDFTRHLLIAAREADIFLRSDTPSDPLSPETGVCVSFHTPPFDLWETLFPAVASGLGNVMPKVTSLEMIIPTLTPSLLTMLRRATGLSTLIKLSAKMTRDLIPQLQFKLPSGGIALPQLDTIVFTDDKSMWGWNYQSFLGFLRWRSENGAPIKHVYFLRCLILEDVAKELAELGLTVHGDLEGMRWQNL